MVYYTWCDYSQRFHQLGFLAVNPPDVVAPTSICLSQHCGLCPSYSHTPCNDAHAEKVISFPCVRMQSNLVTYNQA